MMTNSELARLRRQMQRRIRVVLAQRRVESPIHVPRQRPDRSGAISGEPTPED